MASMTRGGRPQMVTPLSCSSMVTGSRRKALSAAAAGRSPCAVSQRWVATERPAACPAASRKYCVRRARRGPLCRPARSST
eukprot:2190582-Lingulodinium_polyedra.AAC.1